MPGTLADLLDTMKLLKNELRNGASEPQEAVCVRALNHSQHMFENVVATRGPALQTKIETVVSTTNTESTAWPTNLLRIDQVWRLANGIQVQEVSRIDTTGGHTPSMPWPFTILGPSPGAPYAYYANQEAFYWLGKPDAAYTFRIYGFIEQPEFAIASPVVRTQPYFYPRRSMLAISYFAVKLMNIGIADDVIELDKVAVQAFTPLIKSLKLFQHDGPRARVMTQLHTT